MMEKQFVEMVKIAEDALARKYEIDCPYIPCPHLNNESVNCDTCVVLNALYDKGYRKQSECVWEKRVFILLDSEMVAYRCSQCNTTWDMETKFCPNCGAKMKGGES